MKGLLYRVLLFFAVTLLSACSHEVVHDEQGHSIDLTKHPGKWLVINYWAPWCFACTQELPEMNQFYLMHRNQILVYGFDYDQPSISVLVKIRKQLHIDFPLLLEDPALQLSIKEDIQSLPVTFIYNPQGQLIQVLHGPQTAKTLTFMTRG